MRKDYFLPLKGYYLLSFFGVGSLAPLLGVYLSSVEKLNGTQIGTLLSIGPILMIFFQPIWGIVSDSSQSPPRVLALTTGLAGIFGLGYMVFHQYELFIFTAVLTAIFQSAIIPVSDSISIYFTTKHQYNYGNIRMFGSLGFGLAVFVMGRLSEYTPVVIFYAFFIALTLAAFLSLILPNENTGRTKLFPGIKELFTLKKFIVFLLVTFLFFGPNLANNFYFGIYVNKLGGSYSGIGFAYLIAVLSEIPFMRLSGRWIQKWGVLQIALLAGIISMARWFFYSMEPGLTVVYASAIIQGLSMGLFIPAGLQYIRNIIPVSISATAITIYAAIGNGLGNWFSTYIAGIIFDSHSIFASYLFFAFMALLGVLLNLLLLKKDKNPMPLRKVV